MPDVDGLEVAGGRGAAGDFAVDGGGAGCEGFDGGAEGAVTVEGAADEDVALLAIANTVDAIDGFPSPPPPSNEPLDTCLAAAANAP